MAHDLHPAFFGYGSLVNRATHTYEPGQAATLTGWRRVWRHTTLRDWPFLSAEPAEGEVDGFIAAVPRDDWALLDRREAAYRRQALNPAQIAGLPDWAARIEIYSVAEDHAVSASDHPILLSYLDTVVQGFQREFGTDGVERFFATTANWGPVLDDRAAPYYPRHQPLSRCDRHLVDGHIEALGLIRRTL